MIPFPGSLVCLVRFLADDIGDGDLDGDTRGGGERNIYNIARFHFKKSRLCFEL